MMKTLFLGLMLIISVATADTNYQQIMHNIDNLMMNIDNLNVQLQNKHYQQQEINQAIIKSEKALNNTAQQLNKVESEYKINQQQLIEIQQALIAVESVTTTTKNNVNYAIVKLYQQIATLNNESHSIINYSVANKAKQQNIYLITLLQFEVKQYKDLNIKLSKLHNELIITTNRINHLDHRILQISNNKTKLVKQKKHNLVVKQKIEYQIKTTNQKIANLRHQQLILNKLLASLNSTPKQTVRNQQTSLSDTDNKFLSHNLVSPVNGTVISNYGELQQNTKTTGILFKAHDTNIVAIYKGVVRYASSLPGFGQVVVIDHGDNYVSIYAGGIVQVTKDQKVTTGQVIANAGNANNQPMGGIYFELRHLGQPVNPESIIK
jgi:septal ring factor EnvC (AmiA/AmiB activator)